MATDPRSKLPKRFQPLYDQAMTEASLRYGSQESGLASILGQLSRQHERDLQAQQTANMSLLGSLKGADKGLQGIYSDSGLTPAVQATLVGTPTGARLAGELASARTANQGALLGAQASNEYNVNRLNSDFGDKLQQVSDQTTAEQKERGTYVANLLDQLISSDRGARHDANVAAAQQAHSDLQAELDRQSSTTNAALGQGYTTQVNKDGSVSLAPIPGGKADPNNPKNKPKRTTGAGTASPDAQRGAATQFSSAFSNAQAGIQGKPHDGDTVTKVASALAKGRPAGGGGAVYDTVPVTDSYGRPRKNADGTPMMKQVPRVYTDGPQKGQRVTAPKTPAVPAVDQPIAQAAAEQAVYGYVTTATVRALQKIGYSVNQIPGFVSESQYHAARGQAPTTQRTRSKGTKSIRDIYG